jgi:hypothetical protein
MGAAQVEDVQGVYISRGLATSPTKQPTRKARNIILGGITFMPTVDFLRMPSTAEILPAVGEEDQVAIKQRQRELLVGYVSHFAK